MARSVLDTVKYVFAPEGEVADMRVLLLGDSTGRMTSGLEVDTPAAALYTVSDGRIVEIRHFLDQEQARRAAGLR